MLTDTQIKDIQANKPNVALITLDSCRYDSMAMAKKPQMDKLGLKFEMVYSPGAYTLPSHISMFKGTSFPSHPDKSGFYNHKDTRIFGIPELKYSRKNIFDLPSDNNILWSFNRMGYTTYGIGGVGWFDPERHTSRFWREWFDYFYYDIEFKETAQDSLSAQIDQTSKIKFYKPYFYFLNVSITHIPYKNRGLNVKGQSECVEEFDRKITVILDYLRRPLVLIITADHGDCLKEAGDPYHGHNIYHNKVFEVPLDIVYLKP